MESGERSVQNSFHQSSKERICVTLKCSLSWLSEGVRKHLTNNKTKWISFKTWLKQGLKKISLSNSTFFELWSLHVGSDWRWTTGFLLLDSWSVDMKLHSNTTSPLDPKINISVNTSSFSHLTNLETNRWSQRAVLKVTVQNKNMNYWCRRRAKPKTSGDPWRHLESFWDKVLRIKSKELLEPVVNQSSKSNGAGTSCKCCINFSHPMCEIKQGLCEFCGYLHVWCTYFISWD